MCLKKRHKALKDGRLDAVGGDMLEELEQLQEMMKEIMDEYIWPTIKGDEEIEAALKVSWAT